MSEKTASVNHNIVTKLKISGYNHSH